MYGCSNGWQQLLRTSNSVSLGLVMGPGQNFLTRVGLGQPFMVWVWIRKIYPKNVKFFNFLPFGSGRKVPRSEAGRPLIYCRSKVSSGRVGSGPSLPRTRSQNIFFSSNSHHLKQLLSRTVIIKSVLLPTQCKFNWYCVTHFTLY